MVKIMNVIVSFILSLITVAVVSTGEQEAIMNVVYYEPFENNHHYYELESQCGNVRRQLETFGSTSYFIDEINDISAKGTNSCSKNACVHTFDGFTVTIITAQVEEEVNEDIMVTNY